MAVENLSQLVTNGDELHQSSGEAIAVKKLPEGDAWQYELKLDGYRALAVKREGRVSFLAAATLAFPSPSCTSFAPIEAFQLRIPLDRVHRRFTPQITQQRVPLFAHRTHLSDFLPGSTEDYLNYRPPEVSQTTQYKRIYQDLNSRYAGRPHLQCGAASIGMRPCSASIPILLQLRVLPFWLPSGSFCDMRRRHKKNE